MVTFALTSMPPLSRVDLDFRQCGGGDLLQLLLKGVYSEVLVSGVAYIVLKEYKF